MLRKLYLGMGLLSVFLSTSAAAGQAQEPVFQPVLSAEQEKVLAAMRGYAEQYVSNLPNFLCIQITKQFETGENPARWQRGDTLTSKLVYNQGREERSLELVNDKPPKLARKPWRTPLTTTGEFGMLLDSIFSSNRAASFVWNGWDVVRGKRVAVFNYSIDKSHSMLSFSLSDLAGAILPYHGSVYADAESGAVWRIVNTIDDIPPELQTRSISTEIEYEETAIGSANYLLPVQATVRVSTGWSNIRNEIQFKRYRKFEADSTIVYAPSGSQRSTGGTKRLGPGDPPYK